MLDVRRPAAPAPQGDAPRLLVVGQGASPTGYARVIHSILRHLPDGWDLHHLATDRQSAADGLGPSARRS